jgi:hypothetical protein
MISAASDNKTITLLISFHSFALHSVGSPTRFAEYIPVVTASQSPIIEELWRKT